MSHEILIGISPPKEIIDNTNIIRTELNEDSPNIIKPILELYSNSFTHFEKVLKLIKGIEFKPFDMKYEGLKTYDKDPIVKDNILIYRITDGKTQLNNLKQQLVKKLKHLKTTEYEDWLISLDKTYNLKTKELIRENGSPFKIRNYLYHTKVCSNKSEEIIEAYRKNKKFALNINQRVDKIELYIKEDGEYKLIEL